MLSYVFQLMQALIITLIQAMSGDYREDKVIKSDAKWANVPFLFRDFFQDLPTYVKGKTYYLRKDKIHETHCTNQQEKLARIGGGRTFNICHR